MSIWIGWWWLLLLSLKSSHQYQIRIEWQSKGQTYYLALDVGRVLWQLWRVGGLMIPSASINLWILKLGSLNTWFISRTICTLETHREYSKLCRKNSCENGESSKSSKEFFYSNPPIGCPCSFNLHEGWEGGSFEAVPWNATVEDWSSIGILS